MADSQDEKKELKDEELDQIAGGGMPVSYGKGNPSDILYDPGKMTNMPVQPWNTLGSINSMNSQDPLNPSYDGSIRT